MHQVESLVDVVDRHLVRDQIIDVDLAVHIPVDYLRHLRASAHAAECSPLPDASGHQLKRSSADFLSRSGHTDDDRYAPAAMATFQRLAHQIHVADTFETIIRAAVSERHQVRDQIAFHLFRIHEMGQAEFLSQGLTPRIQIHAYDFVGANHACALDDVEADPAQTEYHHIGSRLYFGCVGHRANPGGHAATDVTHLVERGILPDFRQCNLRQHRKIRERGTSHVVVNPVF